MFSDEGDQVATEEKVDAALENLKEVADFLMNNRGVPLPSEDEDRYESSFRFLISNPDWATPAISGMANHFWERTREGDPESTFDPTVYLVEPEDIEEKTGLSAKDIEVATEILQAAKSGLPIGDDFTSEEVGTFLLLVFLHFGGSLAYRKEIDLIANKILADEGKFPSSKASDFEGTNAKRSSGFDTSKLEPSKPLPAGEGVQFFDVTSVIEDFRNLLDQGSLTPDTPVALTDYVSEEALVTLTMEPVIGEMVTSIFAKDAWERMRSRNYEAAEAFDPYNFDIRRVAPDLKISKRSEDKAREYLAKVKAGALLPKLSDPEEISAAIVFTSIFALMFLINVEIGNPGP